ncbi:secreted RxLR effector protein 161-like [Ipomoea triloba]|uniref:secreted RxLR effector protein 161-like n=1 Tax=Ipomoea triloba TaxID=35885 RepID=UPI00125E0CAE|nr:secreted RxLR effector protein 161-like [Ipomoea triloba]
MENIPYATVVGCLGYIQVCTRPGIAFAVKMLGRYLKNLDVVDYSDADFAGCFGSRRSTSRYVFVMADGAISWRSVKQSLITTSTVEAEFVTYYEETSQGVWLKNSISVLRVMDSISKPLKIYYDSSVVVFLAKNDKNESRSKHIDIKFLAIRERVKNQLVIIEHISIGLMLAYPFTKAMPLFRFKDLVEKLRL